MNGARGIVIRIAASARRDSAHSADRHSDAIVQSCAPDSSKDRGGPKPDTPHWDADRRVLSFRGTVLRIYKNRPAQNQTAILDALEAAGWPDRIENPLPDIPKNFTDPRLNHTVRDLNKSMEPQLIRFGQDGTGRGVLWKAQPPSK